MRDAAKLAEDYITLWNETDQSRRRALLATTWTASATYVDPLMQGRGHHLQRRHDLPPTHPDQPRRRAAVRAVNSTATPHVSCRP